MLPSGSMMHVLPWPFMLPYDGMMSLLPPYGMLYMLPPWPFIYLLNHAMYAYLLCHGHYGEINPQDGIACSHTGCLCVLSLRNALVMLWLLW